MATEGNRKRFAVQLATGAKDVGRVKSALMFATLAQLSDCDTIVYCVQDGADAVVKGRIREEGTLPPGVPTFEQRLKEAIDAGVRLQLCGQVAQNQGVKKEDLVEGAEIVGGIHLITYALDFDGMLFF
ncbi:MAG: DsrE family protein [Nitrospirota bacterium]